MVVARDMAPGAVWMHTQGPAVILVDVSREAVAFSVSRGSAVFRMPAPEFRTAFAPIYNRTAMRQRFSMSLANLDELRAYWIPSTRKLITRGLSSRKNWNIPQGAVLVGQYAPPCTSDSFLEDLDGVLSALHAEATTKAA